MLQGSQEEKKLDFNNLGLSPRLLTVLAQHKFVTPTRIQAEAIPVAVLGKDVVGIAETGTGKTLAFVLPLLQQISATKKQALIILPTRELAMQVEETLEVVGRGFGLRKALLIGGASMGKQIGDIRRNPHVIVGTPGRIIDHLDQRILSLRNVGVLVLDEADHMFDMGFAPQIKRILSSVPIDRQTMLFSATMPPEIEKITLGHMRNPVRIEISKQGTVGAHIDHHLFVIGKEQKNRLLDRVLADHAGTVLVFSRTKHGAKRIARAVRDMGHGAAEIHSNLTLSRRKSALEGFKKGQHRVLVATDIAARGIDVEDIQLVVNYDLPDDPGNYVHRIGRTGRAGREGKAITFITSDQRGKVRHIERLIRLPLVVKPLPLLPAARPVTHQVERGNFPQQRRFTPRSNAQTNPRGNYPPKKNNYYRGR